MNDPIFFRPAIRPSLAEVVDWTGAAPSRASGLGDLFIENVATLDEAGPHSLAFFDKAKYLDDLAATHAMACFVTPRYAARVPPATLALVTATPARDFARVLAQLYPDALIPGAVFDSKGESPGADIHPEARLEPDVVVDPGAVIGPYAEIGSGTMVGANAVIGPNVRIGRGCAIGPGASIANALIGNRVIIHTGVRIGQDGFGYIAGPSGHIKVPQIGRVIIQDDVEIGANTTIDRGSTRDTVIGEGTKIDNLVQIGHNVHIGRHCLIVAQAGISGATELGDFVGVGGQAGFASHLEIGNGAQIAAQSGVIDDLPPKAWVGGTPARAFRAWLRGEAWLARAAGRQRARNESRVKPADG
ncbi:MAG: UDP-3-O-(3-hydroxymyristoyl)glucosamine N-acyltransferase [Methylovirgula sp.]|nr:UDP-3-O-(3-hydroxymyristoyl)glucosamine N-acyltransferase [Methylovirgula sp.]